jgi:predicted RNA binding protein YcfA (HicA-like mRNA interferase family)
LKAKELLQIIESEGWYLVRQKGSHRQYKHAVRKGLITVAFHRLSDDVAKGTLNSILKQAGLKEIIE